MKHIVIGWVVLMMSVSAQAAIIHIESDGAYEAIAQYQRAVSETEFVDESVREELPFSLEAFFDTDTSSGTAFFSFATASFPTVTGGYFSDNFTYTAYDYGYSLSGTLMSPVDENERGHYDITHATGIDYTEYNFLFNDPSFNPYGFQSVNYRNYDNYTPTPTFHQNWESAVSVPEPTSMLLMGLGLLGLRFANSRI